MSAERTTLRRRYWLSALFLAACDSSGGSSEQLDAEVSEERDAGAQELDSGQSSDLDGDTPRDTGAEQARDGSASDGSVGDGSAPTDGGRDASSDASLDASQPPRDAGASASGETVFVSVGGEGNTPWLYTSCDGRAWTRRMLTLPAGHPTAGEGAGLRGVGYGAGTFVIAGGGAVSGGNVRLLGSSQDGVTWQWEQRPAACADCQWMGGAAFLDDGKDGIWIAGGGSGTRLYSRDGGRTWQTSSAQGIAPYRRFRSAGGRAVGAGQGVLTVVELAAAGASEPVRWTDSAQPSHESVFIAAGNGAFVAIWYDDGCRFLREGTSWRTCSLPSGHDPVLTSVVFGNGKFSILGHGAPLESSDGERWTIAPTGSGSDFRDVTYESGTYATPDLYSSDTYSWKQAAPSAQSGFAMAAGKLGAGRSCPR